MSAFSRALVIALIATAACDGGAGDASTGGGGGEIGDSYLPIVSDFQDFRSWPSVLLPAQPARGEVHLAAARRVYINRLPPEGATEFPVGTLIVKESEDTDVLADRKVFAMAKRVTDGSYNATGARGWEWWELENVDESTVVKVWSGVGPPAGHEYGGDANGGCNTCHVGADENDFVFPGAIDLSPP
jgi:hypothetical protein